MPYTVIGVLKCNTTSMKEKMIFAAVDMILLLQWGSTQPRYMGSYAPGVTVHYAINHSCPQVTGIKSQNGSKSGIGLFSSTDRCKHGKTVA